MVGQNNWLTRAVLIAALAGVTTPRVASADEGPATVTDETAAREASVAHPENLDPAASETAADSLAEFDDTDANADAHPPDSIEWMPSEGRECRRRVQGGRRRWVCDGPRRVPVPEGADAARAEELGLGTREIAGRLLVSAPLPQWVDAVDGSVAERLAWPVDGGHMWRGFGRVRRDPRIRHRLHKGIDIGAEEGTAILAAADGIVAYSDNGVSGYGNLLMIVHADGSVTSYAHCRSITVFPGQQVRRGQAVAEVGTTGLASGAHLHFEYREAGRPRNPIRRMDPPSRRRPLSS